MARGIERREIFRDDEDRERFVELLEEILGRSKTLCYAWVLMPNHFHLLLESGVEPVARVMQALLGRHAARFNRRHRRVGHLFQNRYKAVLCDRDAYFRVLVRYIHLNPVRAGLIRGLGSLARYRWSGHRGLVGDGALG